MYSSHSPFLFPLQSRTSTHSMPYTVTHGSAASLDELAAAGDFNHAPGSRLPPHRGGGRPYSDYEYDDHHLPHGPLDGGGRGSLSQGSHEMPPWDWGPEHQMRLQRPREQFEYGRGPYDYDVPPPPRSGPYEPPPMGERQSRSLQRNPIGRSHDDYSPSPGPPPFDHRHPMMPPSGHSYGHGYDPQFEPPPPRMRSNSRGPPLPPSSVPGPMPPPAPPGHGGPLPMHHPMNENRFRPVAFRSNTPSDAPSPASLPSMSPGPSPHPTPPPTPPPPNPGMMGPGPPPRPHGPPFPGPPHMHGQGPPPGPPGPGVMPPPHMGGPMPPGPHPHPQLGPLRPGLPPNGPHPPHPWEPGPGMGHMQRDFPPQPPHPGPRGMPPPLGHAPSPGPHIGGGGPRYPGHPAEWERNWKHH